MERQVLELKAQIFDILAQQEMLQVKINQLNQSKAQILDQLRTLVSRKEQDAK